MTYLITPNMNLTNPLVGVETGPQYSTDVYNSLNLVDSHDHTPGHGVKITPAGLNINAPLDFQGNSATNLNMTQFTPVGSPFPSSVMGALYEFNQDLYYNDGAGNVIQITGMGSVIGPPGSISGLPSGTASVSYLSPTYTFRSGTNAAGNLDAGSITIRTTAFGAPGITIKSPAILTAGAYQLTLPASLPSFNSVLTLDNTGAIAASTMQFLSGNLILPGNLSAVGTIAVGGPSGPFLSNNAGNIQISSNTLVFGLGSTIVDSGGALSFFEDIGVAGDIAIAAGHKLRFLLGGPVTELSGSITGPALISTGPLFYPSGSTEAAIISQSPNALDIYSQAGHAYTAVVGGAPDAGGNPLRIVAGGFNSSGFKTKGYGFTCSATSTGVYVVQTDVGGNIFADSTPIAIGVAGSLMPVGTRITPTAISTGGVQWTVIDSAGNPFALALDFMIIGLRGN